MMPILIDSRSGGGTSSETTKYKIGEDQTTVTFLKVIESIVVRENF